MNDDKETKIIFAQAMTGAAEILGGEMTKPKLAMYFKALSHHPIEVVERAIMRAVSQLKYFPKPVELLEFCGESKTTLADQALLASSVAMEALEQHGTYRSVVFDDPIIMAVIQRGFGGWNEYARAVSEDGPKWSAKEFCKFYESFARQGVKVFGHLPGLCEIDNSLIGAEKFNPPVALIGNREKALVVAEGKNEIQPGLSKFSDMIAPAINLALGHDQYAMESEKQ